MILSLLLLLKGSTKKLTRRHGWGMGLRRLGDNWDLGCDVSLQRVERIVKVLTGD